MLLHRFPLIRLLAACLLILAAALGGGRHLHGGPVEDGDGSSLAFIAALGGEICLADPAVETARPAPHAPSKDDADCPCCLTGCLSPAVILPATGHVHAAPRLRASRRGRIPPPRAASPSWRRPGDPSPRAPPPPPIV